MNFLSILASLSADQIRFSNINDSSFYDQSIFFNYGFSSMQNFVEYLPFLEGESNFVVNSGYSSQFLMDLGTYFVMVFTITYYSGSYLLAIIGIVTLSFLFNFCISIRVEVSKIRLTLLSFISVIFTFFILLLIKHFLFVRPFSFAYSTLSDAELLAAYALNIALMLFEPLTSLVRSSEFINAGPLNMSGVSSYTNLQNIEFQELTDRVLRLENSVYNNREFHKSAAYFDAIQQRSTFLSLNSNFINNTTKPMEFVGSFIASFESQFGFDTSKNNFLDHTELRHYQTFKGGKFFVFSSFFCLFFLMLLFIGFSDQQFLNQNKNFEFIWLLWLFIISGLLLIMSDLDLIEVFIALECLSFCSYILISLERSKKLSSISGIRYLIISALPSALLILGIIFLYKQNVSFDLKFLELTNSSDFLVQELKIEKNITIRELSFWEKERNKPHSIFIEKKKNYFDSTYLSSMNIIKDNTPKINTSESDLLLFTNNEFLTQFQNFDIIYFYTLILISIFFIVSNLSFKLTAAPFHFWAPVIYNNGLLSSVIFLNVLLKLIIFLFLIIFVSVSGYFVEYELKNLFLFFALMSFFFGAGGAINERFIKRFFVYSSMVDVGFILLVFSFYDLNKVKNILLYLLIYNLSSMIIWFFLLVVRKHTKFLTNLSNILNNNNLMKFIFSFVIFSMAGIPPFAGFFIKYNILKDIVNSENFWLSFLVLLFTVLSLFYYLRLIKIIMFDSINNTKSSNVKNNNFKYILFALLLNFVVFFLVFVQESFLLMFDDIANLVVRSEIDLADLLDRTFSDGTMAKLLNISKQNHSIRLDTYLGSNDFLKRDVLIKTGEVFELNKISEAFFKKIS